MARKSWQRIPVEINSEDDRRVLAGMLAAYGLEVRVVKIKYTNRGTPKRFVEYRDTGMTETKVVTQSDGKSANAT